jgi:hypothetical protein
MRATTTALVPCCLLFCGTLFSSDVGADGSGQGDTGRSRVFNVLRYGAVGDDKTVADARERRA